MGKMTIIEKYTFDILNSWITLEYHISFFYFGNITPIFYIILIPLLLFLYYF